MTNLTHDKESVIQLILCDENPQVIEAWKVQFKKHPAIQIKQSPLLESGADACLCPGNAFGFMDSGLSYSMSQAFGWEIQDKLRQEVRETYDGELLMGQAVTLPTRITPPWLVYSPTVRATASACATVNAYLSMRGALIAVINHNQSAHKQNSQKSPIQSLATSGLCTGEEGMHPHVSARQIRYAYEQCIGVRSLADKNFSQLSRRETKMKAIPASGLEE